MDLFMWLKLSTCLISLISNINNSLSIQSCNWCCKHKGKMNGVFALTLPTEFLVGWEVEMVKGYCLEMDLGTFKFLTMTSLSTFHFSRVKFWSLTLNQTGLGGNCFKWGDASQEIIRLVAPSMTENIKIEKLQGKDKNSKVECLQRDK